MKKFFFNDQQGNRDRPCRFGIVFQEKFYSAEEAETAKLAVFKQLAWKKEGKWSNSDWEVTVSSASLLVCMEPFDDWSEDLEGCMTHVVKECVRYLKHEPSREEALVFFQGAYPRVTARVAAKAAACEELV